MNVHVSPTTDSSPNFEFFQKGDIVLYVYGDPGMPANVGIVNDEDAASETMISVRFWSSASRSMYPSSSLVWPKNLVRIGRIE